jgi:hypothetical protein
MNGATESPTSYPVPRPFGFCLGWDCSPLMRIASGMGAKARSGAQWSKLLRRSFYMHMFDPDSLRAAISQAA